MTEQLGSPGSYTIKGKRIPAKNSRPEVKLEWNNKSEEDYLEKGFKINELSSVVAPNIIDTEVKRFLSQVDISKVPIQRTVTRMYRIMATDYSSFKRERKEYIYYEEDWNSGENAPENFAKNRLGEVIAPVIAHVEGMYNETLTRDVIVTEVDGEGIEHDMLEKQFANLRPRYYIPFSKKTAEEIIKKSAHSDEKSIRFIVKVSPGDFAAGGTALRHEITADMFLNWSFEELFKWMSQPWKEKPLEYTRSSITDKSSKGLAFTPS